MTEALLGQAGGEGDEAELSQIMNVYVEICIRGLLEDVWRKIQSPDLHKSWNLRFTHMEYLPRLIDTEPQRFLYAPRIGFRLRVEGMGKR